MALKAGVHGPQAGVYQQRIGFIHGNLQLCWGVWAAWAWPAGNQRRRNVHVCLSHTHWKLNTLKHCQNLHDFRGSSLKQIEIIYPEWECHKSFS